MDAERAARQLRLIADTVAMAERLGVQVWLRGGWATDFFLGQVTRDHVDIDWEARRIISPQVQIECKEMMPVWVPGRPRRPKDAEDIARLRQALAELNRPEG
jgi:hypothetical protein